MLVKEATNLDLCVSVFVIHPHDRMSIQYLFFLKEIETQWLFMEKYLISLKIALNSLIEDT